MLFLFTLRGLVGEGDIFGFTFGYGYGYGFFCWFESFEFMPDFYGVLASGQAFELEGSVFAGYCVEGVFYYVKVCAHPCVYVALKFNGELGLAEFLAFNHALGILSEVKVFCFHVVYGVVVVGDVYLLVDHYAADVWYVHAAELFDFSGSFRRFVCFGVDAFGDPDEDVS